MHGRRSYPRGRCGSTHANSQKPQRSGLKCPSRVRPLAFSAIHIPVISRSSDRTHSRAADFLLDRPAPRRVVLLFHLSRSRLIPPLEILSHDHQQSSGKREILKKIDLVVESLRFRQRPEVMEEESCQ
jgi:hypothetical protein